MARSYRMTPKRRAALRKAQLASARKRRRGVSRGQKIALGVATVAAAGVIAHKASGSKLSVSRKSNLSVVNGRHLGNGVSGSIGRHSSLRVGHGSRATVVSYRFGRNRKIVTGRRTRNAVDHDSIPFYNPKGSKSWPHMGAKQARKQNEKLRERGMLG